MYWNNDSCLAHSLADCLAQAIGEATVILVITRTPTPPHTDSNDNNDSNDNDNSNDASNDNGDSNDDTKAYSQGRCAETTER